jgi:UDP:flavonoid glycosyltransferase YjiC (YdhE family)
MAHNFLLVSWGTSGNLNPLLTAGRQLRRAGHGVRVMADPAMRDEVDTARFEFVTWSRAPISNDADPTDFSDMTDWMRRAMFDPAFAYAADIRDEVRRVPTDAVLCIDVLFGGVLGAEAAGVPYAMLSPHISLRPLPGVPAAARGLTPPQTPEEHAEFAAAHDHWVNLLNGFLANLNETRARLGLRGLNHVLDLFDRCDRVLLAISKEFDFKATALPDNVRYVGPLLDVPSWSGPWHAPWSGQSKRPRVLIACSSGAQGQGSMVQRIISAMENVDADAVVTIGPSLRLADFRAPRNVHLVRSASHDAVMPDVSVVVTQGGHGTVSRALINGLPQLILPSGQDQAEIAAAVNRLIADPKFRVAASRLGDAVQADMITSGLVREMEAIVAERQQAEPVLLRA